MSRRHPQRVAIAVRLAALGCAGVWLGVLALLVTTSATPRAAKAAGQNAAAVVVDDGGGPRTFCVLFGADSISGVEALQATRLAVTTRAFGANGAAVCAVGGTGCGAGTDCLTCKAPQYWGYSRAAVGATGFTYSMAGASSTRVTNGSVEGWLWGTGGSPAFASFAQICPNVTGGGGGGGGSGGEGTATAPPPAAGGTGGINDAPGPGGTSGTTAGGGSASGSQGGGSGDGSTAVPVTSIDPVTGAVVTVDPAPGTGGGSAEDPNAVPSQGPTAMRGTVVNADATSPDADTAGPTAGSSTATILGWIVFAVIVVAVVVAVAVLRVRGGRV